MDEVKEYLSNAEMAFDNKQYNEALGWYRKVLEITPDDVYALSRAGAICVPLGEFGEALEYFGRARKIDPANGDNHFNYANACFFNRQFPKAFDSYLEAEKAGCSADVLPRLYYQLALMSSIRQDTKSALIYFDKCEEADTEGTIAVSPDFFSEKIKLYMMTEDYENAEITAGKLVASAPYDFKNYMVYFSMAMAHGNYETAEKQLNDAEKYAEISPENRVNLSIQRASLYSSMAQSENNTELYEKAMEILETALTGKNLSNDRKVDLLLVLAEVYQKAGMNDKAIESMKLLLDGYVKKKTEINIPVNDEPVRDLTPGEVEEMIARDLVRVEEKIASGELDPNMGDYAYVDYDEYGFPVNLYDEQAFAALAEPEARTSDADAADEPKPVTLSGEQREKVMFLLLTSYLAKDEFAAAKKFAEAIKHSDNKYFSYYGLYVCAVCTRKLTGDSEETGKIYAETLAFFRSKMFADHTDSLAAVFRARLYAEEGHAEKAKEIAQLLADVDRDSILGYIETIK